MQIRLSDTAQVEAPGAATLQLAPRDAAMLAWLAVEGPTSRDRLAALLWPGSAAAQARNTLRQRLFQLKKQLGADLVLGSPILQLAPTVAHDLADATELLGDLTLPDAPEVDAWLRTQRAQRLRRERDALDAQVLALEAVGDTATALAVAQALLRLEPLSEAAHRRLMRLHYLGGDRAAALQAFDACEQMLKHEVGARPSDETLTLLATIEGVAQAAPPPVRRLIPAAVLRPPRMVGREREAAALQLAWAGGDVAAVIGEAGMGKSRLLAEFIDSHVGVVRAAGRPGDAGVPFATLARLLRAVSERIPAPARLPLSPATQGALARVLPELGAASPAVATGQQRQLSRALAAYLQAATGLAGLVLDDLHFADPASLEMLQALIAEAEPDGLRWALAYRPADAETPLLTLQTALAESARLAPVSIAPLAEAALAELVDQLGLGVSGALISKALRQRTGGNPLFVLETLKQAWVEQRMSQLAAGGALPRPISVERLIDARVNQLSPGALALARTASIAGVDFSVGLAESVLGLAAMQFADALGELESAQVLKGTQFAHDLVFDAVLRSVPGAIAEYTHAAVARWLEQHGGEPARIARHWIDARQPACALPWLTQAALRAKQALRNAEHVGFLDQRAKLEESLGQRDAAFWTRLAALHAFGDNVRELREAEARSEALDTLASNDGQRVEAWLARSRLATRRRDLPPAEAWARRALALAGTSGDAALTRQGQLQLFEVLTVADRGAEALTLGEACAAWVDDHADDEARMVYHGTMAVLYDNSGQLAKGQAQYSLEKKVAERCGHVANLAIIANNLATNRASAGQLGLALALGQESLRISLQLEESSGDDAVTCVNLAEVCTLLGHYADALHWSDRAEQLLQASAPSIVSVAQAHRALCWLFLGQRARALQEHARIAADAQAILPARVRQHLLACRLSRAAGQPTKEHIEAGLALLEGGARPYLGAMLMIERALDLPAPQALAALAGIGDLARSREYGGHILETQMRAAQMALQVDPELARSHALRALHLAQEYDLVASYRGELWLHCAAALLAAGERAQGQAVLARALAWVQATAGSQVPPEFRESFLHRNPVNVALAALAARHEVRAAP